MTTAASPPALLTIPPSHADLFSGSACGVLTTLGPGGQPESSVVWVDIDDGVACFNTTLERRKGRNLLADPRASLLVVDPADTGRFIQVRGDVELATEGAVVQLNRLTRRYTDHPAFYGHVHPAEREASETRVIGRIRARRITLDAIHA